MITSMNSACKNVDISLTDIIKSPRQGVEIMHNETEPREIKVKTVERTLMLLEILAQESSPLNLTRLSQLSKLSISTVYRLLSTLCRSGFVERDKPTGQYRLGLKAFLVGNAALQRVDIRSTALPFLTTLAEKTGESVYLAILAKHHIIYSDGIKGVSHMQIGVQTGIPIPAFQTGAGKVLLAHLPPAEQHSLSEVFCEDHLPMEALQFRKELQTTLYQEYAVNTSDSGAIREISTPIFNYQQNCVGAISLFCPASGEFLTERENILLNQVKESSMAISRAMGFPARLSHNRL
jgi:DNA-binding IclR family transcriptional regulator